MKYLRIFALLVVVLPCLYASATAHKIINIESKPRFSPDGLGIIYVKIPNDNLRHMWKANIDVSDNKQLTF